MSATETAIIENYQALFASNSAVYAAYTLIICEHMLTFGEEVELFWKRKFTGATAIFLLNRYLILISYIMELASVWIKSEIVSTRLLCARSKTMAPDDDDIEQACANDIRTMDVFYYAIYIPWAAEGRPNPQAFGAVRAYALTNRNRPLAVFVFLLSLVPYGMDMAQYAVGLTGHVDSAWGCNTAIPGLGQTLATHLRQRTKGISRSSLTAVMYRNGMLYFM
ncbi:hypothetical protein C8T65DRAFT_741232 [Cerioporus squamosus]|nr:hypothetical protein C8T65DRAFT_741232 [Cerioporus squamosus]